MTRDRNFLLRLLEFLRQQSAYFEENRFEEAIENARRFMREEGMTAYLH